ncbi:MAG TPA: RNA 2'-phosphotransferase [Tepidisphaeraceae bacterium]|nr:RNA 2'-phosphotransferase [Tepidisphaeraceae bacterium]
MPATSKFLSYVLRHRPDEIGLSLDAAGWVGVDDLLDALAAHGEPTTHDQLLAIVRTNDKQRFALSEDGARIRASQGHSVDVELGYAPAEPPPVLFHGTVEKFVDSIRATGLRKGERHHVHLSADEATASKVGGRRGKPVILRIDASAMRAAGHAFFRSANGVWLTEHVAAEFIAFPSGV